MKEKIVKHLLTLNVINESKVYEYVEFCLSNKLPQKQQYAAHHHILPKAIFSEYKNIKSFNNWNGVYLSYKNHYIAHSILVQGINNTSIIGAWRGMNNADIITKGIDGLKILGSDLYNKLMIISNNNISEINSNMVSCFDKTKNIFVQISKNEFDSNRDIYEGTTKGKVTVTEVRTNIKKQITSEEYKNNKKMYKFHLTNSKRSIESINKEKQTKSSEEWKECVWKPAIKLRNDKIRNKFTDEEWKERNLSLFSKSGKDSSRALKINIYDDKDNLMFECNGDIKYIIRKHNLPIKLIETYRNSTRLYENICESAISRLKNNGNIKYKGWYARKK